MWLRGWWGRGSFIGGGRRGREFVPAFCFARDDIPVSISGVPPGRGEWLWVIDIGGCWAHEIMPV